MTDNLTDHQFLPMNDLCNDSLRALIHHYLSVRDKLPDNECLSPEGSKHDKSGAINLSVRDRLEELQAELINRTSTIEGVIRQNTENPL